MSARSDGAGFRTLADQLRGWSDDRLATLLRERPDLGTPAPHDSSQLASRAATRSSVVRALDQLTRLELSVLDALVRRRPNPASGSLRPIVHAEPDAVAGARCDRLLDLALVWEAPGGLRALSGVAEGLTRRPGRWRQRPAPGVARGRAGRTRWRARLAELSPAARALLDHVDENGGQATAGSARHTVLPGGRRRPRPRSCSPAGCWCPAAAASSSCRARSGWRCAAAGPPASRSTRCPRVATSERDQALVDRAAAGAAFEAVRRVELLLDHWGTEPPGALRSGGLGVRDLKATAALLHVDEPTAALLVEVAAAAGLLADRRRRRPATPSWLPTDAFDAWIARDVAERWATLVARLAGDQPGARPGRRTRRGRARPRTPSRPSCRACSRPRAARMALDVLAELPPGEVLATGTGTPSVVARVAWLRPRRPRVPGRPGGRGRWPRRPRSASPASAGCPPPAARCSPARRRRRRGPLAPLLPEPGRPRADPGRPDGRRARPARVRRSPAGCSWSPTSSRGAAPPSTASPPARPPRARRRLVGRGGARVRRRRCRGRRCRSR